MLYKKGLISLCKKTPNTALFLSLTFFAKDIQKQGVFLLILIRIIQIIVNTSIYREYL